MVVNALEDVSSSKLEPTRPNDSKSSSSLKKKSRSKSLYEDPREVVGVTKSGEEASVSQTKIPEKDSPKDEKEAKPVPTAKRKFRSKSLNEDPRKTTDLNNVKEQGLISHNLKGEPPRPKEEKTAKPAPVVTKKDPPKASSDAQSDKQSSLPSYPLALQPMLIPPPVTNRFVTVTEACEEIWKCQEPEQAALWLQQLHQALLRTHLSAYDPSETFLSLMGAALRFQGNAQPGVASLHDISASPQPHNIETLWVVWEEAVWAAAALARVCVGAAWRHQLHQRRAFLRYNQHSVTEGSGSRELSTDTCSQNTTDKSPVEEVATEKMSSSQRSFSPMTFSSNGGPSLRPGAWFPPIQEGLPAAMLRFAACAIETVIPPLTASPHGQQKWQVRRKSLSEAQRELVLALCYASPEEEADLSPDESNEPRWSILEAHGPVGTMVRFWLESCTAEDNFVPSKEGHVSLKNASDDTSTRASSSRGSSTRVDVIDSDRPIDWYFALQVTRAAADLVYVGWRPPSMDNVAIQVVDFLLELGEKGMKLNGAHLKYGSDAKHPEARDERMTASFCAVEAVSVLASMGSMGLIPPGIQPRTVRVLCELLVCAQSTKKKIKRLFPLPKTQSTHEAEEVEKARLMFWSQRESCCADISDLLWVMLAHESSGTSTMTTLLDLMYEICAQGTSDVQVYSKKGTRTCSKYEHASLAVRTLSKALWGSPSSIPGIPSLRIFWKAFLDSLVEVSSLANKAIRQGATAKDDSTTHKGIEIQEFLPLLAEIIGFANRFIETELVGDECLVTADEWSPFVRLLEEGMASWLDLCDGSSKNNSLTDADMCQKIQNKIESLLTRIGEFLAMCSSLEQSFFHLVVEKECQERLYRLLLRQAAPRLDRERGTALALAAINSWSSFGFMPHRSDEWVSTASSLMAEAFALYTDRQCGDFNGYVHSPLVRMQALVSVAREDEEADIHGEISWDPSPSPLVLTRFIREQHLDLINRSVLPALVQLFGAEASAEEISQQFNLLIPTVECAISSSAPEKAEEVDWEEATLRTYAVSLIGNLFRSPTTLKRQRHFLLEMLRSVSLEALDDVYEEEINLSESNFSCQFEVSLAAVDELGRCMFALFETLPLAHDATLDLLDALCSILVDYGGGKSNQEISHGDKANTLFKFAALLPLSRLRRSPDSRLMLVDGQNTMQNLPPSISSFLSEELLSGSTSSVGYTIAPFVYVGDTDVNTPSNSSIQSVIDRTSISLHPVCQGVIESLLTSLKKEKPVDPDIYELEASFRAICYDTISGLSLSGITVASLETFSTLLAVPHNRQGSYEAIESLSRCRASSLVAQYMVARQLSAQVASEITPEEERVQIQALEVMVERLLPLCRAANNEEAVANCQALSAIITSLASVTDCQECARLFLKVSDAAIEMLNSEADYKHLIPSRPDALSVDKSVDVGAAVMSLLYCIVSTASEDSGKIPADRLKQVIEACTRICTGGATQLSPVSHSLAIRCVCISLDALPLTDIEACLLSDAIADAHAVNRDKELQNHDVDLIFDLLTQGFARRKYGDQSEFGKTPNRATKLTCHEVMASENDDIHRFVVDDTPGGTVPSTAWICGQNLLTFRVGSQKSRYRGWMEVIARSPTSRKRQMIRLPNSLSLDDPEFPSTLWSTSKSKPISNGDASIIRAEHNPYEGDSAVLQRASLLLAKCDRTLGPLPPKFVKEKRNLLYQSALPIPIDHANSSNLERVSSASDEDDNSVGSMHKWLLDVTPDYPQFVRDVEQWVLTLGFPTNASELTTSSPPIQKDICAHSKILRLYKMPNVSRAVSILDRTTAMNTHKISLLVAAEPTKGSGRNEGTIENMLLGATGASPEFFNFAEQLGKLVLTRHLKYFSGGLDSSGFDTDGKFAFVWMDTNKPDKRATTMVVFHSVAVMPPGVNTRKRHVGNDNVHIVFVENKSRFHELIHDEGLEIKSLVSGSFGFVTIFVSTLSQDNLVRVSVRVREGLPGNAEAQLAHLVGDRILSKQASPDYVRRVAIIADMACRTIMEDQFGPLNWEERRRQIREMHRYTLLHKGSTV